jgi:hypothetical protein
MRQDAPYDPAVGAQALEVLEPLGDEVNEPLAREMDSHGLRADPTTGSCPGPPSCDGHDPSQNLLWLNGLAASGRRVTLRDNARPRPCRVDRDHTVTDQLATLVEENGISHQKARRGGWLHRELIPLPQHGVHAPSRYAEAYSLVAEEEVADFQEVCQAKPIAPDRLGDSLLHLLQTGILTA